MSALAPLRPRLAPLIRRLATNFDGERLATVAAIERTLAGARLTWNDLGDAVEHEPVPQVIYLRARPGSWEPETFADVARWRDEHDEGRPRPA